MGSVGVRVEIESIGGATPASPRDVQKAIYAGVLEYAAQILGDEYRVAESYLMDAAFEGLDEGQWPASATAVEFWFRDYAGACSTLATACHHWTSVGVAAWVDSLDALVRRTCNVRIAGAVAHPLAAPVLGVSRPLLVVDGRVLTAWVEPDRPDDVRLGDGDGELVFATLDELTRQLARATVATGQCQCALCRYLREDYRAGRFPQDAVFHDDDVTYVAAREAFERGAFDVAAAGFRRARAALRTPEPNYAYMAACADAHEGRVDAALQALRDAVADGWSDVEHAKHDADLDGIRASAGLSAFITGLEAVIAARGRGRVDDVTGAIAALREDGLAARGEARSAARAMTMRDTMLAPEGPPAVQRALARMRERGFDPPPDTVLGWLRNGDGT